MLICCVKTELVDTGSESPRVIRSTTFCSWLLLLTLQLLLPAWLVFVSPPLPNLVSPISHSSSLYFPNSLFPKPFSQIVLCSVVPGWECTQPPLGISRAGVQPPAVICNGHLRRCAALPCKWEAAHAGRLRGWLRPQALVFMGKCNLLKYQCSRRVVILTQAMLLLLGVLMLVLIFIQEGR